MTVAVRELLTQYPDDMKVVTTDLHGGSVDPIVNSCGRVVVIR